MKHVLRIVIALLPALVPDLAWAQLSPVILEAETGAVGPQFTIAADGATTYAAIQSTIAGGNPTTGERVITFNVTFPHAGVWELYARLRVGPATFNDDSMYYANGFGSKSPTSDADWILANGLAAPVGFVNPTDRVTGGGIVASGVWKWVKLSAFDGGEPPISFTVPAGGLTQTFAIAGREDGLWLDKFAFGPQGVFFTVFDLDNGLPGSTVPPPPPFVPTGPPIATGKPKFLGGVSSPSQNLHVAAYFNQITPENGGKWGSVEPTRGFMNWGELDTAYNLAKANGFPFRFHTLIWGNQQPGWIAALPRDEQRQEIEQWFSLVAARYPDIDFIDVVNEPLHDPPDDPADGGYINALGGTGETGWDWVIEAFKLARQHFPHAKLGLNEFSVTNTTADMIRYVAIVELLKRDNLIDVVGVQGHAFSTRPNIPMATHTANLDRLAATGLPIHVTELDIDGPTDEVQLADYQRIFPVFWEHPAVRGITLWGYRPGHWRTAQGAYIVLENGAERPAMVWLKDYVAATALAPWVSVLPTAATVSVGEDVSFTCQIFGASATGYAWHVNGAPIPGSPATPTLDLVNVMPASAGVYTCVVSHAGGSTTSIPATLTVITAAVSRRAPAIAGRVEGSVHVLLPENAALAGEAEITGDLLMPGTPRVVVHGAAHYAGTLDSVGNPAPFKHTVTLAGNARLRHVVRAIDPVAFPAVPVPPQPAGTQDVVLKSPGESVGDFSTLRHLSLREDLGGLAVPPGTYGVFTAKAGSGFIFGVAGATAPAVYNLQALALGEGSSLQVVGPVILNVAAAVEIGGEAGNPGQPGWLKINVSSGGVALSGVTLSGVTLSGYVVAPSGTVTVKGSGTLRGGVVTDLLVIKEGATLQQP